MFTENNTVSAFVAYVASRLACPVRAEVLVKVCADAGRFDVQQTAEALEEMLGNGVLDTKSENVGMYIVVGEQGMSIMPELAGMLPPSLETDAAEEALREYAALSEGVKYRADIRRTDGGCLLTVGSYVKDAPTCEVRLLLPDEAAAQSAKAHFEAHPDKTLANAAAIVTGDMEFLL